MNAPNQGGPNLLPLSGGLAALAIASIFYLTVETPFQDVRPENPRFSTNHARSTELVQARLWEDPFAAVARHSAKGIAPADNGTDCRGHCLSDLTTELKELKRDAKVVVMPVMVFGGPYPENQEERIRTRYAVLSALGQLNYAPRDGEHIGYFKPYCPNAKPRNPNVKPCDANAPSAFALREIVPYEWFIHTDSQPSDSAVLLLWLKDDQFQKNPWEKLAYLVARFKEKFAPQPYKIRFVVQGPAGSTVLRVMAKEASKLIDDGNIDDGNNDLTKLKGVEIYSPKATVAERYLGLKSSFGDAFNKLLKDKERQGGFYRTIGTDKELAESLIAEIKRRIPPKQQDVCPPHIALISEWDTFYGRTFPEAFRDSLDNAYFLYFKGYDLHLMYVAATDALLNKGHSLVIVALVGTKLHIRIFNASGKIVFDKAENELVSEETLTTAIKQRLLSSPLTSLAYCRKTSRKSSGT
jgi:hypothetical protein